MAHKTKRIAARLARHTPAVVHPKHERRLVNAPGMGVRDVVEGVPAPNRHEQSCAVRMALNGLATQGLMVHRRAHVMHGPSGTPFICG